VDANFGKKTILRKPSGKEEVGRRLGEGREKTLINYRYFLNVRYFMNSSSL